MAAPGRKEEVELVEGDFDDFFDEPDGVARLDAAGPSGPEVRRSAWRRVLRAWPIAVVALLVSGAYLVAEQRASEREATRIAALGQSPVFLGALGPELREIWSVDGISERWPVALGGGHLLVRSGSASWSDGDGDVVVLDAATGDERWRIPVTPGASEWIECSLAEAADVADVVVCVRPTWTLSELVSLADDGEANLSLERETSTVELRDLSTGDLIASREHPAGDGLPWGPEDGPFTINGGDRGALLWGTDFLVTEVDDDGVWLRLESFDGETRWRTRVLDASQEQYLWPSFADDLLFVDSPSPLLIDREGRILLDADGLGRADATQATSRHISPLGGGRYVIYTQAWGPTMDAGGTGTSSVVVDRHGDVLVAVPGLAFTAMADDGGLPDMFVTWQEAGSLLWRAGDPEPLVDLGRSAPNEVYLLDGAVVALAGDRLVATDVATDSERWAVAAPYGEIVGTDGTVLLVHVQGTDRALRALSLRTGEEVWSLPLTRPVDSFHVLGGALYASQHDALRRFGT